MDILKVIFIILEVLLLFNVLIFVHELGHFLAGRWRGLKIERFAIWFGKPIWKTKINGVEFCLGWIPAGGYVSLPQMAPMEVIEGKSDGPKEVLPPISALDKIIVAFAGPVFSFGLAIFFALIVWIVGRPVSESETTTVVGYVDKDSPAEKAGLQVGDKILEVDGKPVTKFGGMGASITWRVVRSEGATLALKVQRGDKILELSAVPIKEKTKILERKSLRQILVDPAQTPIINRIVPDSPAARAGLKRFDQILAVNGQKLYHFLNLVDYIEKHPGEKLSLTVRREGKIVEIAAQPEIPIKPADAKPRIGITEWVHGGVMDLARPGVPEQISASVDAMLSTFGAVFSPRSDIKLQHLSGAVKIMNIYYLLFKSEQGWRLALWFSVIMNVNLAILNLLPVPVLDGGHIALALIEAARRKPVSGRILNVVQTSCAIVLISYMLYVTFYDIQDLPWKRKKEKPQTELQFAPSPDAQRAPAK